MFGVQRKHTWGFIPVLHWVFQLEPEYIRVPVEAVLASLQLVSEEKKGQRGRDEQGRGSNLEEVTHGRHTFSLQNGPWTNCTMGDGWERSGFSGCNSFALDYALQWWELIPQQFVQLVFRQIYLHTLIITIAGSSSSLCDCSSGHSVSVGQLLNKLCKWEERAHMGSEGGPPQPYVASGRVHRIVESRARRKWHWCLLTWCWTLSLGYTPRQTWTFTESKAHACLPSRGS